MCAMKETIEWMPIRTRKLTDKKLSEEECDD